MRRLLALLCAMPFVLAACGGSDSSKKSSSSSSSSYSGSSSTPQAASGGVQTLSFNAEELGDDQFGFSKKKLSAKAGKVTLKLTLPSGLKAPHGIGIEGNGVNQVGPVVQAGSSSTVSATLKPGTYTYFCPVSDHRQEGMEGKLVVK